MARETLEAVFENGHFRPLRPLGSSISEGQTVRLVVEHQLSSPDDILNQAAQVYAGLSKTEIAEIEESLRPARLFW